MALTATVHHLVVTLSDVERNVYERLDLRMARHPSESGRYFWQRLLAYCLSFEEGIAFSKGGLSDADEPPVSIRDATGRLLAWIDVGSPSAERVHRASKAAGRVQLYTATERTLLEREMTSRKVHALERVEVFLLDADFLDALEPHLEKHLELELVRSDGELYVTLPKAPGRAAPSAEPLRGTITETRLSA